MVADSAHMAHRGDRLGGVFEQRILERRIGPGLGDDHRAVARADLCLIGLDDGNERGRIALAIIGKHRLQSAHAQLRLAELRAVVMIVVMVVIVLVSGHGDLRRMICATI
jgi:hypothetical protein